MGCLCRTLPLLYSLSFQVNLQIFRTLRSYHCSTRLDDEAESIQWLRQGPRGSEGKYLPTAHAAQAAGLRASTGAAASRNGSLSDAPGCFKSPRLGKQFNPQHILLCRREMYTHQSGATIVQAWGKLSLFHLHFSINCSFCELFFWA